MPSILLSFLLTSFVAFGFLVLAPDTRHWFVLPAMACGVTIGIDAVEWLRGRMPLLDPTGLVGLLGFHVVFLNPLLVAALDHRMRYLPDQPDDYRPWLGVLSILIFFGLLMYRWSREAISARLSRQIAQQRSVWRVHHRRFWTILSIALLISGTLQAYVYYSLGGVAGYINAYSSFLRGEEAFQGTAPLFAVSEAFPILLMMGFAVWAWSGQDWRRSWGVLAIAIAVFAILVLLFGGLRGSRSNSIWGLFWAIGIIHLYVRRVPRGLLLGAVPALLLFLGAYAIYKNQGDATMEFLANVGSYEELQSGSERAEDILLGDLGRSDVQAFLLYRLWQNGGDFNYAYGRSYLGALVSIVPRAVWPSRPAGKIRWTTEAEFGPGSYENGDIISTRVYGLVGESVLNFGPYAAPVAFLALGAAVAFMRRFMAGLDLGDSRRLIVPFFCNFCFLLLLNDSDNQMFYLFKYGLFPGVVILLSSGEDAPITSAREYIYASPNNAPRLAGA